MASVVLSDVVKRFGDHPPVLSGVSLEIRDGELMVLVGPSGCGKSTILRLVAGVETPSAGTVAIGGRVVNDVAAKERGTAMVFQSYALYAHMSVRENLDFGLKARGAPADEIDRRVRDTARMLGLEPLLDRRPRDLTNGERQRVALGRAVIRNPAVFLFDEPFSGLDAKLRAQMHVEVKKVQKLLGVTSLYVTADDVEAQTMGDRIAILNDGIVQQVGTPAEVHDRPDNLFVAGFIGSPPMSFIRCRIADAGALLVARSFALPAPPAALAALAPLVGRTVVVGVRPENLLEAGRGAVGPTAPIDVVTIDSGSGEDDVVQARQGDDVFTFKTESRPPPGQKMTVLVELDRLHLFDAESERRLVW